jgi:hypothetical protein
VRCAYKVLVGKPEGKRDLGRTGLDGRTILKWTLGEILLEIMVWNCLFQGMYSCRALVNTVMNF